MEKVHKEELLPKKVQVIPQEVWLSKSLPNLEDLLATIPQNILVSQEEELASQKDFENIMYEVKRAEVHEEINQKHILNCMKCKFNTTSNVSLDIHIQNVHESNVFKCDQCLMIALSDNVLKTHKELAHSTTIHKEVIKKSLNFIKGEAGGLSDYQSNPKRGQGDIICNQIVSDVLKIILLDKRDIKSNKPCSKDQIYKNDSTPVDKKPGSNFEEKKKEIPIVIKNPLNLIKGEAGGLSDSQSNPKRGQAVLICKLIVNDIVKKLVIDKREKQSKIPGSDCQEIKKKDSTKVDIKPGSNFQEFKGGDGAGEDEGGKEAGVVVGGKIGEEEVVENKKEFDRKGCLECKICETVSKNKSDHKKHLTRSHSEFAVSVATHVQIKNNKKPQQLHKCVSCERNFFFKESWKSHIKNCHFDMTMIGGGEGKVLFNADIDADEVDIESNNDSIVGANQTIKIIKHAYFTEKQWGNDDDTSDPAGINFKSKLPEFKKSVDSLKKIYRKGSVRAIGKTKIYAEEVNRKGSGTEVKLNITDQEGEGEVVLSFWSPTKKSKETTVQINSKKGSEKRFVKLFAHDFVRDIIEGLSNGNKIEDLFERGDVKVACTFCNKLFLKEATLKIHLKSHILCNKCGESFKKENDLQIHKQQVHISKSEGSVKTEVLSEVETTTCKDCGYTAPSRKTLMIHIENVHIGDSWLVNTKRDENMMNSVNENTKTKTKEPPQKKSKISDVESEEQIIKLSDLMDQKVIQKRKLEEERESTWQKEKENLNKLREEKNKKDEIMKREQQRRIQQLCKLKEKQNKVSIKEAKNIETKTYTNLPKSVEKLLGDEYELERIPGDGSCGMGCFAKHAYNDASLGPEIGKILNKDIAENIWYFKQLIEFPYIRNVGGSEPVRFEQHEEDKLLDFLRNHPRNGFIWRGFMDMQALGNKYGITIKIVSIKDFNDPNPKIERMEPDGDFEVKEKY